MTVFGVANALARNPQIVAAMREADWDIACHGLKWIDYKDFSYDEESAHMREAIRIHTEATGHRPLGWYTGRTTEHTLKLVLEDGGFLYSSDSYADDLPYWVNGPKGPHVIIPYSLDANDMRFINAQGFPDGEDLFHLSARYVRFPLRGGKRSAENDVDRAALPIGRPAGPGGGIGPISGLYRQGFDRVWVASRLDIARHWHHEHMASRRGRQIHRLSRSFAPMTAIPLDTLNTADQATFLAALGEVMEHSPWVAEGTFAQRPFASLAALYQAMTDTVRGADDGTSGSR